MFNYTRYSIVLLTFLVYFQPSSIFGQNRDWDCSLYTQAINTIYQKHLVNFPSENIVIEGLQSAANKFIETKINEYPQQNQLRHLSTFPVIAKSTGSIQEAQQNNIQLNCDWGNSVQSDFFIGNITEENIWLTIFDSYLKSISSLSSVEINQQQENSEKEDLSEILYFNYDTNLDILYIQLNHFSQGISEKIIEEIESYPQLKSILFNLFYNSGGNPEEEHKLINYFIPKNSLATVLTDKKGNVVNVIYKEDSSEINIPIGIIVGPYTGSAAENFTEVLKQHGRAFSYGHLINLTAGKGHSTGIINIGNLLEIRIPVYYFYPPNGQSIEQKGVFSSFSLINLAKTYPDDKKLKEIANTEYGRVSSLTHHIPMPPPLSSNHWNQITQFLQKKDVSDAVIQSWKNKKLFHDLWDKYPQEIDMNTLANRFLKINYDLMNKYKNDNELDKFLEMNNTFHYIVARQMLVVSQAMCPSVKINECNTTHMLKVYNDYDQSLKKLNY